MSQTKIKITDREDLTPICPHCNKPLDELYIKSKGLGFIEGKNVVYFCPACLKVLGMTEKVLNLILKGGCNEPQSEMS